MTLEHLHAHGLHLHALVAMAENRVIGYRGKLPWHLPDDLKLFKKRTLGHPIVMGRLTFESLAGQRPLPRRRNIVVSRTLPIGRLEGIEVIRSLDALTSLADLTGDAYLIGGAKLFQAYLPLCDTLILSLVKGYPAGDVFLPPFEDRFQFIETLETFPEFEIKRYRNVDLLQ